MKKWTDKAERGSYSLILLIAWLARTVGRSPCRMLLYPIVLYFFLTDRPARRASAEFLQTVSERPVGWRRVFQHIYTFAATLLDRVYMASGEFHRFEVASISRQVQQRAAILQPLVHVPAFRKKALNVPESQTTVDGNS